MLSQFTRMFPPPRSVPSVHDAKVIWPTPGVSLEKSAAEANIPDNGGPLNWGVAFWAEVLGVKVVVNDATDSVASSATRKILFLLIMFFSLGNFR